MSENGQPEGTLLSFGPGGSAGVHGDRGELFLKVGTATEQQTNRLRPGTFPIACWRANDANFEFDSSFPRPELTREMGALQTLREQHPGAPLSLFGHADPVGNDDYNKALSGRRVRAIFALLTRQTAIFEELFNHGDWGDPALRAMLGETEDPPSDQRVQQARSSAAERRKLYAAYMDAVCRDQRGTPFQLSGDDFLAGGRDAGGKGDFQGCGEFNPVLMFSKSEKVAFDASSDKKPRNQENAPNRRVVGLLFRPGVRVDPSRWPCPRAKEGSAGCRLRFFSDQEKRRRFQENRRTAEVDHDTFACRFYDRLMFGSPCDAAVAPRVGLIFMKIFDGDGQNPLAGRHYEIVPALGPGQIFRGAIDDDGLLRHEQVMSGDYLLHVEGCEEISPVVVLDPQDAEPRVRCLENGRLWVSVRARQGPAIEGATVEVEGLGKNLTDSSGIADFGRVEPGLFRFAAHKDGFSASGSSDIPELENKQTLGFALSGEESGEGSASTKPKAEGEQSVEGRRATGEVRLQSNPTVPTSRVTEIKAELPGTPSAQFPSQKTLPTNRLTGSTSDSTKLDVNPPVVLVMGGGVIQLTSETNPAGRAVQWKIDPNPSGATPPKLTPDSTGTKATLKTDQEGSFSVTATLGKSRVVWNFILVAVIVDAANAKPVALSTGFVDLAAAKPSSLQMSPRKPGPNQAGALSGEFFDIIKQTFDHQAWTTDINVELRAAGTPANLFAGKISLGYLQNLTFQNLTGRYDGKATAVSPSPQNAVLLDAPEAALGANPPFPVVGTTNFQGGGTGPICPITFHTSMRFTKNFSPDLTKQNILLGDSPGAGFDARIQQPGGSVQKLTGISGFMKFRAALASYSTDAKNMVLAHAEAEWLVDFEGTVAVPSNGPGVYTANGAHTTPVSKVWQLVAPGTNGTSADRAGFEIFPPLAIQQLSQPQKNTF